MGQDVSANGRSILHKGHGMTHTCAVPDVCKTPTPGGPVPIPYVNIAMDSDITDGAETVKIEGNPVANVGAKISTSTGDEAGSAGGGIISSKIKGTVTWKMGSLDVKAEGKSVVRFLDQDFHNGNTFNANFVSPGFTGMAYGNDFDEPCPVCKKEMDEHKILETDNSAKICADIIQELKTQFQTAPPAKKGEYAKEFQGEFSGYMVGVMICKCPSVKGKDANPSVFAAMSGIKKCLPGFKRVAESKGVHVVIGDGDKGGPGGKPTWQDFANANPATGATRAEQIAEVQKQWKKAVVDKKKFNYSCAGAHLVTKAKHAPENMTEMYFMPSEEKELKISYRAQFEKVPGEGTRGAGPRRFGTNVKKTEETPWGPTVGSCETCQNLLFLTMCPVRTCS